MANRANHYERALAAHLHSLRLACIPTDESRRPSLDDWSVKSLDFIVTSGPGRLLLVDVKGRKLSRQRPTRENWATRDDIASLQRWERAFGPSSTGLLVFVYLATEDRLAEGFEDSIESEGRTYGVLAVSARDYRERMRVRSPRWQTVSLLRSDFIEVARPLSHWLATNEQTVVRQPAKFGTKSAR